MDTTKKPTVCIVTFPISAAGNTPLSNLIALLEPLTSILSVITGNAGYEFIKSKKGISSYCINHKTGKNIPTQILKYIWVQLKISYQILQIRNKTDCYIFFIGGEGLIIPLITVKLFRKKAVLFLVGFPGFVSKDKKSKSLFSRVIRFLSRVSLALSDNIILYSHHVINERHLEKYREKIIFAHEHFINFEVFNVKTQFNQRKNIVGYVGRLTKEKGVLNLITAISILSEEKNTPLLLVIGDGNLKPDIERYIELNNLKEKVKLVGWVSHNELLGYLNTFKLLVIPSYTEGLPNVMLEAMACGTPVLASNVGAIPEVIKDSKTGFLIENNSPEDISDNIKRALNHPKLQEIAENARELIEETFSYEKSSKMYWEALSKILN